MTPAREPAPARAAGGAGTARRKSPGSEIPAGRSGRSSGCRGAGLGSGPWLLSCGMCGEFIVRCFTRWFCESCGCWRHTLNLPGLCQVVPNVCKYFTLFRFFLTCLKSLTTCEGFLENSAWSFRKLVLHFCYPRTYMRGQKPNAGIRAIFELNIRKQRLKLCLWLELYKGLRSSRPECRGGFQTHTFNLLYFYPIMFSYTFSLPLLTPLWQGIVLQFLSFLCCFHLSKCPLYIWWLLSK